MAIAASYVAKAFRIKTGTRCAMPGASALKCTSLSPNTGPSAPTQPPVQSATKRLLQRLDCPPYPHPTSRPSSLPRSSIRILTAGSFEFGVDAVLSDQQIGGAPDVDFGCHRRVRGRGWSKSTFGNALRNRSPSSRIARSVGVWGGGPASQSRRSTAPASARSRLDRPIQRRDDGASRHHITRS